jgi:hypothetical protein
MAQAVRQSVVPHSNRLSSIIWQYLVHLELRRTIPRISPNIVPALSVLVPYNFNLVEGVK